MDSTNTQCSNGYFMIPTMYLERFTFLHFKDKDMAGQQHTGIHYPNKYGRTPK